MADVVLLTPRETVTGSPSLNNQHVVATDEEYVSLDPAMRIFYEKIRENLGLACIASYLRHAGHSVRVVNLHGRTPSDATIVDLIQHERPRLVGISIMYDLHIADAVRLIRCVREAEPGVFIAIGGAFCTYNAALIAELVPEADCVTFGEGEMTVVGIMHGITGGGDWRTVPGLFFRDGNRIRGTGMPVLPDLLQPIWPARDVLASQKAAGIATPVASTYTSRGCHAKCTFCYAPHQPGAADGRWRIRPALDVVDEIEYLQHEFGTRFIWFNDDNFGGAFRAGFAHAVEFAEEVLRRRLQFSFHCEFRVDSGLLDREALNTLRRAGLRSGLLGMESGSPAALKRLRKGATVQFNYEAARIFRSKGLKLDPGWIMVDPKTSIDELWENLEFIVGSRIHETDNPFSLINRAIALRGTEMYAEIVGSQAPVDVSVQDEAASAVLHGTRREYRIPDRRVEALWTAWSVVGGEIADRKENKLPFLAQSIAIATRRQRGEDRSPRSLLGRIRSWCNDLPNLFAAFLNFGLGLADEDPPELDTRLMSELRGLLDSYDQMWLGATFSEFVNEVELTCGPVAALAAEAAT